MRLRDNVSNPKNKSIKKETKPVTEAVVKKEVVIQNTSSNKKTKKKKNEQSIDTNI